MIKVLRKQLLSDLESEERSKNIPMYIRGKEWIKKDEF